MMQKMMLSAALALLASAAPGSAQGLAQMPAAPHVAERPALTLAGARAMMTAAEAEAVQRGLKVTIVIVDPAGVLVMLHRMDDATTVGPDIAMAKARTAAGFNQPTAALEMRLQKEGQLRLLSMPALLSEGGIPVKAGGRTVGAIGVSGATSQEDGLIAAAGAAALAK